MAYDVIIVGAGLAGLTAAKRLCEQGYSVLLLEARDRLGGRIHTLYSDEDPIELGALYLYGRGSADNPNPLMPLFQTVNLEPVPINPVHSETFDTTANPLSLAELFQSLQPYFEDANKKIQTAKRKQWKIFPSLAKVLDYLDLIPSVDSPDYWARKLITATVMHHTGASLEEISLLELLYPGEYEGNPEIVVNGYQKLIQGIFDQSHSTGNLTVHLGTTVREIYQDPNAEVVKVVTQNGKEYRGITIISAIAIGVLKKGTIRFTPSLSKEKQQALKHLKMAAQDTVVLEFEKPFWPEGIHYIYPNDPNPNFWPEYINLLAFLPRPKPILLTNFYGPNAKFGQRQEAEWIEHSLKPLRKIYGKSVTQPLQAIVSHWDTDPYTLGRSAYCGVDCTTADLDNLSAAEGRLHFAGDYTQHGLSASLNAAYESGLRAALEIEAYFNYQAKRQPQSKL